MWPFKKKFPPLESLPAEDEWSVGQGENDGKPMIGLVMRVLAKSG